MIRDGKREKHNAVKIASIDKGSKHKRKIESRYKLFWINEFSEALNLLELPTDFKRPSVKGYKCDSVSFELTREETGKLKSISDETGATMYMILLSAYNIFLSKLSNQEDIIVGVPVTVAGHMNTLPLRNYPKGNLTFRDFLSDLKQRTLTCLDHKSYAYEDLINALKLKHDISRNPLFDVMFLYQNIDNPEYSIPGVGFHSHSRGHGIARFDLTLSVDLTLLATETEGELYLTFEYSTELFKKETVERFVLYFREIISTIIIDDEVKISEIEIITEEEKRKLVHELNDTKVDYSTEATIVNLFEEQVSKTPDNVAVVFEGKKLTYRELNERSDDLARKLLKKQIDGNNIVAIYVEPSLEMFIGILGILKAGLAFLPLDKNMNLNRLESILEDSNCKILITQTHIVNDLSFSGEKIIINRNREFNLLHGVRTKVQSCNLAYVIYTSGSTGKPKGAKIRHSNLYNYALSLKEKLQLASSDKSVLTSSFAFDLGYTSIFPILVSGGELHIIPKSLYCTPDKFLEYIDFHKITYLKMTPSLFSTITRANNFLENKLNHLKHILLGGETIIVEDIEKTLIAYPHIKFINHYGPTETTIGAITHKIDNLESFSRKPVIGKPINNTKVYILDKYHKLVPFGVPGELCIGGRGVCEGYFNRDELTREKFISSPFSPEEIIYKTGDLARRFPDGNIEFLGRIDNQVKINGYRIEIGEVESCLLSYDTIKEAAILIKENNGNKFLVAYYTSNEEIQVTSLRKFLSKKLPDYMIPVFYVHVDKFPLTPNGKIDRKALPEPENKTEDEYVAPSNKIEDRIALIWSETLGIEKRLIGINHNFFMLGGNSLNAIKAVQKLKTFIPDISTNDIFLHPTIKQLSRLCFKNFDKKNKKYSNTIEIENRLKSLFNVDARFIKYLLPNKVFIVLFINKNEVTGNKIFKQFIVSELDEACQPHYIIEKNHISSEIKDREIKLENKVFFRFLRKMSLLSI